MRVVFSRPNSGVSWRFKPDFSPTNSRAEMQLHVYESSAVLRKLAHDQHQCGDCERAEEPDHEDLLDDAFAADDDTDRRHDDGEQKSEQFHGVTSILMMVLLIVLPS